MKKFKSIVTGGAGFIGSNLVDRLVEEGHKVIVIDNFVSGKKDNLSHHSKKNVKIIKSDISNNRKLYKHFKGVNYVFHLAGLAEIVPSIENPRKYFMNNTLGTSNILESVKQNKIKNCIIITSDKCYLNKENKKFFNEDSQLGGDDIYSASKACAEIMTRSFFCHLKINIHL